MSELRLWAAKHGAWAALALMLIAAYLWKLDPVLASIVDDHNEMRAEVQEERAEDAADTKRLENLLGQILRSSDRNVYLLRVQCQNSADTPTELRACAKDE